ncbi:MAG: hypothetical protein Q9163_004583 [Psora crenata]
MSAPTATAQKAQIVDRGDSNVELGESLLGSEVVRALSMAIRYAFDMMNSDGHWRGELLSNVTITAEHILFCQAVGVDLSADSAAYKKYLLSQQRRDGSWGIAPDYPGDVSTSAEAYLALKILGVSAATLEMQQARDFISRVGGVAKVRVISRIYFAQFGLFPWEAVPQLPAEFIFMPSQLPINVYALSSWARSLIIPLLIIRHHQPIYALPNGRTASNDFIDEIWLDAKNKMVPHGPTLLELWRNDTLGCIFGVLDKVLCSLGGLRRFPLRGSARRQCVNWILEHQENSGDWAGIIPPMHASILALLLEDFTMGDPRLRRGLSAIEQFAWQDEDGKRIQACISPVWDTVLMTRGLCDAGVDKNDERLQRAVEWCKTRQQLGQEGDWQPSIRQLIFRGTSDTVDFGDANSDGGWAAFDVNNNKLFLNKIPFCDMNNLCDPSSADVTGRVLEAFGLMAHTSYHEHVDPSLLSRITNASDRAITYLAQTQESCGTWYGRWGVNYIYGTSNVLCGLVYFSKDRRLVQDLVDSAIDWLKRTQNAEGGWGEGLGSYQDPARAGRAPSTPSQTAWALMGLLTQLGPNDDAIKKGVTHLVHSQTKFKGEGASWQERQHTATGFPGHFYLNYTFYRHYFPVMALGRYMEKVRASNEKRDIK